MDLFWVAVGVEGVAQEGVAGKLCASRIALARWKRLARRVRLMLLAARRSSTMG